MKNKRLELNKFAFPLMVNFILSYILELSDIAIVARVSTPAFNAVNLVSSTLYTISGVLGATAIIINTKLGEKPVSYTHLDNLLFIKDKKIVKKIVEDEFLIYAIDTTSVSYTHLKCLCSFW